MGLLQQCSTLLSWLFFGMQKLAGNLERSWNSPSQFVPIKDAFLCFQFLKAFFDFSLNSEFPRFLTHFVIADYITSM